MQLTASQEQLKKKISKKKKYIYILKAPRLRRLKNSNHFTLPEHNFLLKTDALKEAAWLIYLFYLLFFLFGIVTRHAWTAPRFQARPNARGRSKLRPLPEAKGRRQGQPPAHGEDQQ